MSVAEHVKGLAELFSATKVTGTRSAASSPLIWPVWLMFTAGVASFFAERCPLWVSITLLAIGVALLLGYYGILIYLLLRQPDLLRSEKFLIEQQLIRTRIGSYHDPVGRVVDDTMRTTPLRDLKPRSPAPDEPPERSPT